jgi:glucose uptake protein
MLIPTTYLTALLLLIFSALCWGSWANTQKLAGKWRFELYYYDFTWGLAIAAIVAAFTLGSFDSKELTFQDTLLLAAYRKMAWGVAAGVVFNFANMLLVAAVSVAGMAVAFPIVAGLAVIVGIAWSYSLGLQADPLLLFGGILLVLVAVFIAGTGYSMLLEERRVAAQKALTPDPRGRKPPRRRGAAVGILLAVFGGLFMGAFYPLLEQSRTGEDGTGPYGVMVLFALGVFISTAIFVPFFLNFPVYGQPLAVTQYFKGTKRQHFLGFLGGVVWCAGGVASAVAFSTPLSLQVGSAVNYALGQTAAMVIAALWGLLVWHESSGATYRVKMTLAATLVLFLVGVGLMAISPARG